MNKIENQSAGKATSTHGLTCFLLLIFFYKFCLECSTDSPCSHLTCVAGPYPFSFRAAILKMMAGLVVKSMCAEARLAVVTTHEGFGPQYTRTNANWAGVPGFCSVAAAFRTARYTEYSVILPAVFCGGSHDKWAPSVLFKVRK